MKEQNDNQNDNFDKGKIELILDGNEKKKNIGIIQKKLKILIINGEKPEENGSNYLEMKALIENGTGFEAVWEERSWMRSDKAVRDPNGNSKCFWDDAVLCYGGKDGVAVKNINGDNIKSLKAYVQRADVFVFVNSDRLDKEVYNEGIFNAEGNKKIISYGDGNGVVDEIYEGRENFTHLDKEDGCENLLGFIQGGVDLKHKNMYLKKRQGGIFSKSKVLRYARKNKKKIAGGLVGLGAFEELIGHLGFGKSLLGAIFGYNSNSKSRGVKDNKNAKNEKNKEVNNPGNQVK